MGSAAGRRIRQDRRAGSAGTIQEATEYCGQEANQDGREDLAQGRYTRKV